MNTTLAAKVGGGAVILTGAGIGGTYMATKTTAEHELKGEVLEANNTKETEWTLLVKRLEKQADTKFTGVKNSIKTSDSKTKSWELLLTWCSNKYSSTTSSAFQAKDQATIDLVKVVCSNPLIKDKVEDDVLPQENDFNDQWKAKSLEAAKETSEIKTIFKTTDNTDDLKRNALKSWCSSQYSKPYSEKWTDQTTKLIDLVEKWCIYTIKEKITPTDATKLLATNVTSENQSKWENKFSSLKTANTSTPPTPTLTEELKKIVTDNNTDEKKTEGAKALAAWCATTQAKSYTNKTKDLSTLASTYCVEP